MPAARASAGEHQGGEASLHVAEDVCVRQGIDMLQEVLDFVVGFEEIDHWFVQPVQRLVLVIFSRVMYSPAVEHRFLTS